MSTNRIICPRCGTKTMRKALGKNPVAEYFDDRCHSYFTVEELVHVWGYDAGDFGDTFPIIVHDEIMKRDSLLRHPWEFLPEFTPLVSEQVLNRYMLNNDPRYQISDSYEPEWFSKSERDNDYACVTEMLLDIPAWATEDYSVDTGATHV